MDPDPCSKGLYGQDPPGPPCVPVSPRPRDKARVPKRGSVPVSCRVPPSGPPGGTSQLEVLLKQVHCQKKVCEATTEELVRAQGRSEELRQELEQLEQQKKALERTWQQVQGSLQRAQLQGKEVEAKGQRLCGLCLEQQQDLEATNQQWEQLRNLHREQRWQYCQQLEAISEELKHLHVTHAPAHLKAELAKLEKMKEKWLSLERRLMDTEEQLGPEGAALWRLVQQEQEWAGRQLEVELGRQQLSRQRRDRLAEELQQLQHSQKARPE
ncbi:synaptonemal complex central element protein 1 [Zonotrichia albicollis]|uniref:synaptonemal complex central element protein 1 n=1 Tax=Zonotrichia albicollis TaxID=44394 RepID=UPI003D810CB3